MTSLLPGGTDVRQSFTRNARTLVRAFAWIDGFATLDGSPDGPRLSNDPVVVRRYYRLSTAIALGLLGSLAFVTVLWNQLNRRTQGLASRLLVTLGCTCSVVVFMAGMEFEGNWLSIDAEMTHPASAPVAGHRLLFVWVAKSIQAMMPGGLSNLRSYYASQAAAAFLAIYAPGRGSALVAGETFSRAGQVLGAMLLASCFSYYTFHGVGIVFFTTCGLMAMYTRRYWWLAPIVAIGTLNHEGILLLIPTRAWVAYKEESARVWMPRVAAALASLRCCDGRIRRMTILFPCLIAVTFVFGHFHEPRQFGAFIPVLVAVLLTATASRQKMESEIA